MQKKIQIGHNMLGCFFHCPPPRVHPWAPTVYLVPHGESTKHHESNHQLSLGLEARERGLPGKRKGWNGCCHLATMRKNQLRAHYENKCCWGWREREIQSWRCCLSPGPSSAWSDTPPFPVPWANKFPFSLELVWIEVSNGLFPVARS